ncbi:type II toxin-antitoxin system tRNA(fMet)-specific endonuclease VapC [Aggregatilinea lenta]|uniref:type II toxin-antitoxin system tRNA(fMet)-specific endonuclease VapC n=1 Tax=Aggregatilinea lenta TaxID=913108 RepID=UPI000E5A24FB|nr:type II toxin-antitoxin system VapC family toxin [Aggregatilinea lenta]
MKYLLDTNACIRYINGRSPQLRARISGTPRQDVAVSMITKAEMFYGSAKSKTPQRSREKQVEFLTTLIALPFDDKAAVMFGPLRAELERHGTPIGQYDMLIAAVALAHDLTLVTHNVGEFGRITGLQIEDWEV